MKQNVRIAKKLLKLAKELCGTSVPINKDKVNEHIEQALDPDMGWSYFVEKLTEYRDNIQDLLNKYSNERQSELQIIDSTVQSIKQKLANNPSAKLSKIEKDLLTKYNILSPVLPNINTEKADEIRVKCESLMISGEITDLFNAFSILIAREHDASTMSEKLIEHINQVLNDNDLKVYVRSSKQGNQKDMVKSFFDAAQTRGRLKNATEGIKVLRKNLVINLTTLEGDIIAYDSVSNAYVQTLEILAKQYPTMDLMESWLDKGYEYDSNKQVWYDPKTNEVIMDTKKIKTPQKVSSIKTAGIMDWFKKIGNLMKECVKSVFVKGKNFLSSFINIKDETETDLIKSEEYIDDIKQELIAFNRFMADFTSRG